MNLKFSTTDRHAKKKVMIVFGPSGASETSRMSNSVIYSVNICFIGVIVSAGCTHFFLVFCRNRYPCVSPVWPIRSSYNGFSSVLKVICGQSEMVFLSFLDFFVFCLNRRARRWFLCVFFDLVFFFLIFAYNFGVS